MYEVSNIGRVRSWLNNAGNKTKSPRLRKLSFLPNGYLYVALCKKRFYKNFFVHRLVATAFIKNPKNKSDVNHKDSNRSNNLLSNLEWCTRSENIKHGFLFGNCRQDGEKNNSSKLTNKIVTEIRIKYSDGGYSQRKLASEYGVSQMTICRLTRKDTWTCI